MRVLLLVSLLLTAFRSASAVHIFTPDSLIEVPHDVFWMSSMYKLSCFFARLDYIIARLKGADGERFCRHIPYTNDHLSPSVSRAINSLTIGGVVEILREGNELVIEAVLEKGMKFCFSEWSKIDLAAIPGDLIASFPIEFMPKEAISGFDLEMVVECVLARIEAQKFKDFYSLIPKLSKEFWIVPRIRSNFNLRLSLSGFHMDTFKQSQLGTDSGVLEAVYTSPQCHILEFILNLDLLGELEKAVPISDEIYEEIMIQFPFYFYILQTFLHEIVVNNQYPARDVWLFSIIIKKSKSLQKTIEKRNEIFPSESANLARLMTLFSKCFSSELMTNLRILRGFFSAGQVELVRTEEMFHLFAPLIPPTSPELVLNIFIMKVKEGTLDQSTLRLIENVASDLLSNSGILIPFKQFSHLISSFAVCLQRNRLITEEVRRNFGRSGANGRDIYIVSRVLVNDFEYLKTLAMENESGVQRQLKFSTIFTGAFIDSISVAHEHGSRFHHHTRELGAEPTKSSTWSLEQAGSAPKFGEKMTSRIKMEDAVDGDGYSIGKKRCIIEADNLLTSKDLLERAVHRSQVAIIPNISTGTDMNFNLPDISAESTELDSDEYVYLNQLTSRKVPNEGLIEGPKLKEGRPSGIAESSGQGIVEFRQFPDARPREQSAECARPLPRSTPLGKQDFCKSACPEVRFIYSMMSAIGRSMLFPSEKMTFSIEGSRVSGDGVLRDSLTAFGRLVSLTKFKTFEFKEKVDGFVPMPLLCPKIMAFMGAWTALCLKHEVPLAWAFAPIYRKFLYKAFPSEIEATFVDTLIEEIYGDLLGTIQMKFDSGVEFVEVLPKIMKSHRMFDLPPPLKKEAAPFLFDGRFLESQGPENSLSRLTSSVNAEKYLKLLKYSLKKHLYEGREEFLKYFGLYFKKNFIKYLKHSLIDEFVGGGDSIKPEDLVSALWYNGGAQEFEIIDDFEEIRTTITPIKLMEKIIMKMSQEEIKKFLWFVTGSSRVPLTGFNDFRIAFSVKEAAGAQIYSLARVCFKSFTLIVHNRSARETFTKFIESITMSDGFSAHEV